MRVFRLDFPPHLLSDRHRPAAKNPRPSSQKGALLTILGLVLIAGVALGQPPFWEQHMKEGDSWEKGGHYQEARAAYQLAVKDEGRPSDSGLRQAVAWNRLALIDCYLGLYSEARQHYQQALEWFEKSRGSSSPEYASLLHNLAVLDYQQGQLDEAARQFRRVLKIREDLLGKSHPATAQTLNSLSAVYTVQGRYVEAERLCQRALAIEEKALGPEHPQVSAILDNLASTYSRRGQFETAVDLSRRAEQIARKAFGDQHPITCLRANKLAVLYGNLGRLVEAEALLRRILEIQLLALGEDNPDVATTLANLAAVSSRRQLPVEAVNLYRRALPIFERSRSNDQKLVIVLSNYAWLLRQTGRSRDAKRLEARARAISVRHQSSWGRYTVDVGDLLPSH
jgi:tetratricopeptide (TPR) repeat protein